MSIKILYKNKNEELFWQYWQKMVVANHISPRYLKTNIETYLSVLKNDPCFFEDASFVYLIDNKPVAGVFLPIEKREGSLAVSYKADFANAPIFAESVDKKKIFAFIDEIAKEKNIAKIMFSIDPLESESYNYLQEYNYLDASILTYVINLDCAGDLMKACRKGHRCDIKKALMNEDFSVFFVDKQNPSYETHEEYREFHHKCSGRITRAKETFDLQYEDVKNGNAVLFGLKYKEENIAYAYFKYNFEKAVYASGADNPEYDKFPVYHILIFSAMEYLKKNGARFINTEQPSSPSAQLAYYPDKKQLNIALFKRGFPGGYANNHRGIKYFSKKAFDGDIQRFAENYAALNADWE